MKDLKFSTSPSHINKMLWEGSVTKIDSASDGAPCGSDGRRVVFSRKAVETKCNTLSQMPLNCVWPDGWFDNPANTMSGHDQDNIIGYISEAWVEGNDLMAKGVVWKDNFPDIAFMIVNGKESMGFSVECYINDTHDGEDDGFLYVDDLTFVGCAMLWKNTAAFSGTYIRELVAQRKDDVGMTKEEIQGLFSEALVEFGKVVDTKVSEVVAKFEKVNTDIEALACGLAETKDILKSQTEVVTNETIEQLKASNEELTNKVAELEASNEPQRQTAQFSVMPKFEKEVEEKVKEINASDAPMVDKFARLLKNRFSTN